MMRTGKSAFTWTEALVALLIISVLTVLALPMIQRSLIRGCGSVQVLSNMKQLHLATQQMALDATASSNSQIGWPGNTGGSFSNWMHQIVDGGYLNTNDLCKLLSGPGIVVPPDMVPTTNTTAVLFYAVTEDSVGSAVFLTSANFTNTPAGGLPPLANAKPYGDKGIAVFRKAGDGAILMARQAGDTNLIGGFVPLCR